MSKTGMFIPNPMSVINNRSRLSLNKYIAETINEGLMKIKRNSSATPHPIPKEAPNLSFSLLNATIPPALNKKP